MGHRESGLHLFVRLMRNRDGTWLAETDGAPPSAGALGGTPAEAVMRLLSWTAAPGGRWDWVD